MVDSATMRKEWKEIFSSMDQDQSGSISQLELYKFIVKVHKMDDGDHSKVDWAEVKAIFKSLDKDGDRTVDWEEFFEVVTSKLHDHSWRKLMEKSVSRTESERFSKEDVKELFYSIDKDGSGEITKNEALRACKRTNVMNKLGVEDVEEWLKLTDKDGSGTISYDEFKLAFLGANMLDI